MAESSSDQEALPTQTHTPEPPKPTPRPTETTSIPVPTEVPRPVESNPERNLQALIANLEQADQETQGSLLIKIPSTSGGDILFLKNPESTWEGSRDKARRTNSMGVGSGSGR